MVASMGMLGGMFGGGGAGGPNPYAGMNPYGGGMAYMPPPSMDQRLANQPAPGQRSPQGPIPPHIQAMLAQMQAYNANPAAGQYPGVVPPQPGQTPWGQAGPQGQMPPGGFGGFGGILSGLMGGASFGPQQAKQKPQFRPQQRQPQRRRQTSLVSGPNNGNVLF